MKKLLDRNITDALMTSDEWESFDYNLQQQIQELSRIGYDEKPEEWKKNTLAYSYLWHAEKLLKESGAMDKYTETLIEELKKGILKYEGMKILLLTLRLATMTARAGVLPAMAKAEADKLDNSRWTRELKKAIMREALQNIFAKYPTGLKTLGYVWNKFDFVNKGETFTVINKDTGEKEKYKVETGKNAKSEPVILITGENSKVFEYSKRSLQHFIDDFKTQKLAPSRVTQ